MTLPIKPNPAVAGSVTTALDRLYVDKRQLAEAFSVSLRTVDTWKATGLLPYIKLGGTVRYDLEQCLEIVKKRFSHREDELWNKEDGRYRSGRKKKDKAA